jgi:hypothetical protein
MAQAPPPPPPPPPGSGGGGALFQPKGVGDILSAAFDLYKRYWQTFIQIVAIVVVPLTLIQYFLQDQLASEANLVRDPTTGQVTFTDTNDFWAAAIGSVVFALIGVLITQVLTGAISRAAAGSLVGDTPTPGDAFKYGFHRLGSIILIGLLVALIVAGGFFLLIIPGIIFAVKLSVSIPALIVENRRGTDAISRSWNLTTGHFWHVLGTWIVAYIIAAIVTAILTAFGGDNWFVRGILASIASVITTPFVALVTVLLYLDLRARKEGLSEEVLRRELAASSV